MIKPGAESTRAARLAFVGDLMFGRLVSQQLRRRDPEWFWGDALGLLKDADAVFGNLECAITTRDEEWRRSPKEFHFRADPACVDVLKAGNIRFVSLANNHALDFETHGLLDTIRHLDEAGIAHAGAGLNCDTAAAPAFIRAGPIQVAAFAVTDNMPEAGATEGEPGIRYVEAREDPSAPASADLDRARCGGVDLIVVSAHLGPNMVVRPSGRVRAYKRDLVARGADLVHGHSAHVVQGLERTAAGLILHDCGDFIDDYAVDPRLRNDLSILFLVEATKAGIERVRLIAVRLHMAQVRLAEPPQADLILGRVQMLSQEFGLEPVRTEEGLQLDFSSVARDDEAQRGSAPEIGA
jgi:poly-gamma-glutamate synthesis protein (capsule biosynthesis protein)